MKNKFNDRLSISGRNFSKAATNKWGSKFIIDNLLTFTGNQCARRITSK